MRNPDANSVSAAATQWHGVFLAEAGAADASRLTLAEDAIVVADRNEDKLEVHLRNGSAHDFTTSDPARYNISSFAQRDLVAGRVLRCPTGRRMNGSGSVPRLNRVPVPPRL